MSNDPDFLKIAEEGMNDYLNQKNKGNIVLEPGKENILKKTSEILIFHIRSISKDRFIKRIGKIKASEVQELKNNLNDILRY